MVAGAKSAAGATAKILDTIMRPDKKIREFGRGFFQGMREELRGSKIKENVDGIGKAISGLAQKLIIFQLLKQAFSSLIKGAKEAFSAYLVADKSLGASVRDLQASLKTLQGSLASAFAPIVEAVVPYLSTMVNWLITAANAVAQFTAALMGKSVYKKASANIAATGAAAGSAANQVEKLNKKLGAYDELKTIDQDNGSGGSGGGGGGGASGGGIDYEDVDIDSGISDFAEKVKQAWAEADFTEVGTIVGTKLKDALDNINWEGIKATTEKMAKSIATFLNGFVATPGLFNSIGSTIAEGLNTAMTFASTFLNTFDFKQFGTAVMEGIGGFFKTFSWSTLASVLQGWADSGMKFITGIIQGVDWKNLPQNIINSIKDFFSGFDFKEHFKTIGELIGSAVAAGIDLLGAIGKVIGDIGTKIRDYFVEKITAAGYDSDNTLAENGKAIIVGIFNGIKDFFVNIGTWINDNILQPFVTGFKSIFGIHSPADNSQITSLGTNIIEGIFGAIITWFGNIKQWITDNVFNKFKDGWKAVFGEGGLVDTAVSIAVGVVEDAKNWVADAWTALSSAGKTLTSTVKAALEKAKSWAADAWTALGSVGKTLTATVSTALEKAKSWVGDAWDAIKAGGTTAYATIKAKVEEAAGSVMNAVQAAWEEIKDKGATLSAKVANAAGSVVSAVSAAWETIKDKGATLSAKVANAAGSVITTVSSAWEAIKDKGATLSAKVANAAGSVISTVSSAWEAIKDKGATLSAKVANAAGSVISTVTSAWSEIKDKGATLTAKVANAAGSVINTVSGAWDKIKDASSTLTAKVADAAGSVRSTVTSAWDKIKTDTRTLTANVKGTASAVISTLGDAWTTIKTKTATLTGKAKNATASVLTKLKSSWSTIETTTRTMTVRFVNAAAQTLATILAGIKAIFSAPSEKTITVRYNSNDRKDARGGTFHGGRHHPISQAAGGGSFSHGSVIVAGEHGAEVAGHIHGRTEILNQSQLAAVMYSSVVNGMAAAIGAVMGHMTECTNAIIANIAYLVESLDYVAAAMPAYSGINTGFVPDINRTSGVISGGMSLDALAAAVADRISGNIQIENVMNMDGRAVYRGMVEIDRQTIRQTGRSGFGG